MSTVNLLPDDYTSMRAQRRANAFISGLFAVVMAGVLTAAAVSQQSNMHTVEAGERTNKSYEEAAKLIGQVRQLEVKRSEMLTKAEHSALLVEKVPRSYLLALVTNALPKGASITRFELVTRQVQAEENRTPAPGKGVRKGKPAQPSSGTSQERPETKVEAQITGLAATDVEVAKLIANLARSVLMDSVDLVYSQEKLMDEVAVREFQIKVVLRPDADVIQAMDGPGDAQPAPVERGRGPKER